MVCSAEVIVDRFGNADHSALIVLSLHELTYFVTSIHGVIATVIEKVADIMFLKYFEDAIIIAIIFIEISKFMSAGSEDGRRCLSKQFQLLRIFLSNVEKPIIQNSDNSVFSGIDFSNGRAGQSRAQQAGSA